MDVLSGTLAFNSGTGVSSGTFNAAAGTTNSFNGDYTFNSTSFTGSRNVVLAGGTLTFDGTFNFQNLQQTGGTLAGSNVFSGVFHWSGGNWNSVGATTIASNSVLNIVSATDHDLANRALTNYGTVVWSGGRVRGGGNPGTPIYNFVLWDAQSDQELNADYGGFGVTFNNAGTFRKSAGTNTTTIQSGVVFTDTGTVDVQSGALVLNNGGTFSSSSLISGGGSVWLASGAFTLNGIITSPNVQELGGTLVGTNVLNGVLNWTNGTWNGASSVTIASNGAPNIVSAFDHDLPNCALTNYGTVVWSGGGCAAAATPGHRSTTLGCGTRRATRRSTAASG